jgi:hypothetical protein
MIRISILALVTTTAAAAIVSPATAQSRAGLSAPAARIVAHRSARPLYDMVPQRGAPAFSDDPASTGGGSLGYNQMIYNW